MKFVLVASTPESIIPFRGKLIRGLCNLGINVHICAPFTEKDSSIIQELRDTYCVDTHTTALGKAGTNMLSDFRYLMRLIEIIQLVKPDMVLCYTMKPVIYGSIAGWVNKVPARFSMITGLGFLFIESQGIVKLGIQFIGMSLLSFSLRKNNKIFFQNIDDRKLFSERNIIGKNQLTCVVNGSGVDLVHYNVRPLPSQPSFLLIARMINNKGIREYVEAIRKVKKNYPAVKFSMVGGLEENIDGVDLKDIQSWALEGLVDYKGVLSDVRPEIEKCSIYVLPSYREGTPRSVLEAMSMGRAIITTDVPGCRDTVIHGVTGLLVRSKDSSDLANAMERLIEDEKLRATMGVKSREYAVKKYSDDSVVAQIIAQLDI
jgi:glycosyltransferase involved in cell wall biosynthesis